MSRLQRIAGSWLVVSWLAFAAEAGTPYRVADINAVAVGVSGNPGAVVDAGTYSVFPSAGSEWVTDGTAAGTFSWGGFYPYPPLRAGKLVFVIDSYTTPNTLWVTDGTKAGSRQLGNAIPDSSWTSFGGLGAIGNKLVIQAQQLTPFSRELWVSDGSSPAVHLASPYGDHYYVVSALLAVGSSSYFLAQDAAAGGNGGPLQLWSTDGTPGGTVRVASTGATSVQLASEVVQLGNSLLFCGQTDASGAELWRFDFGSNTFSQVADIAPGTASGVLPSGTLVSLGSVVVFVGSTDGATWGVWRSDGTAAGTFQLSAAMPDSQSLPRFVTAPGMGRALFAVNGSPDELWTTDGTAAGTFTLGLHGYLSNFYAAGSLLYGMTFDGMTSTPVRSDGTVSGTVALAGVPSGDANTNYQFAGDASHVFVRAFTPTAAKLYQYLPGANTASMLGSYPRLSTSPYTTWTLAQGVLYFDNDQATTGREPWTSDGTAPNTRLLYDTAPETQTGSSAPSDFASLNDRLYFAADDGVHGRELWTSDGTASGTQLVADLVAGAQGSSPVQLFAAAGELFFFAQDANDNYQLWASKGSAANTIALATVAPTPQSLSANNGGTCQTQGITMGGFVYFAANDAVNGDQLWRSDGTAKGTSRVSDIHPPNLPTMPNSGLCALALSGGRLYFNALQNPPGEYGSIYVSDGTAAGTQPALPVNAGIFASSFAATPDALFFAGGTTAAGGTGLYRVLAPGTPALTSAFPSGIQGQIAGPVGDKVVIVGTAAGTTSLQLYVTDGTTAGTLPIGVPASSVPDMFANNGWVYSLLTPASIGDQADAGVWVTDGSAGGTQRLISGGSVLHSGRNIRGETLLETATTVSAGGSATEQSIEWLLSNGRSFYLFGTLLAPAPITTQLVAGTRLFFANSDSAGSELWAIADEAPAAVNDTAKVAAGASVVVSVLANDSDSDSDIDVRSVRIVDAPKGGTATVNSDGTVTYSANSSFSGADSFTYTVADVIGAVSAPATVAVTVSPASSGSSGGSGGGSSGGGGGGATELFELLVLGAFAVRAASRRRMITRF